MPRFSINLDNREYPLNTVNAIAEGSFTFLDMYVGINLNFHISKDPINHKDTFLDQDNGYLRFKINPDHHVHFFFNMTTPCFFNGIFAKALEYIYGITRNPIYIHIPRKKTRLHGILKDTLKDVDPQTYHIITHKDGAISQFKYKDFDKDHDYNNLFKEDDAILDLTFDKEDIYVCFCCHQRKRDDTL